MPCSLYGLQAPEDTGECNSYSDSEEMCLRKKSMFDRSKSMCEWVEPVDETDSFNDDYAMTEYPCIYEEPHMTWLVRSLCISKLFFLCF